MSHSSTIFGDHNSLYTLAHTHHWRSFGEVDEEWDCAQSAGHPLNHRFSCLVLSVGIATLHPLWMPSYRYLWYWLKAWLVSRQKKRLCPARWGQEELFLHAVNWVRSIPFLCFSKWRVQGHSFHWNIHDPVILLSRSCNNTEEMCKNANMTCT